ncbi:MAG: hypothetical protein FWG47_01910 [Propionibacteriaceae bacterium]|nr:hypothetical protein [Propionibacteriaceae bacterium]
MPVDFSYYHGLGYWHITQLAVLIIVVIVAVAFILKKVVSGGSLALRLLPLILILGFVMNIDMWINEGVGDPSAEFSTMNDINVHYVLLIAAAIVGFIAILASLWVRRRASKQERHNKRQLG